MKSGQVLASPGVPPGPAFILQSHSANQPPEPMFHRLLPFLAALALLSTPARAAKPNFIIIFADDQGYGDLSCFGSKTIKTPNIDRLAAEGRKFTSFKFTNTSF